jgi:signal transduction histidine kinase
MLPRMPRFLSAHASHLVPLLGLAAWFTWQLARSRAAQARQRPRPRSPAADPLPPTWLVAVCSVGAAAVHAAVVGDHFRVSAPEGWFFVACAHAQLAWGVLVARRPGRALVLCGLVGNALIVVVWAGSRTVGLPLGPVPWRPETVGHLDVLATVLEAVVVAGSAALLAARELDGSGRFAPNARVHRRICVSGGLVRVFAGPAGTSRRVRGSGSAAVAPGEVRGVRGPGSAAVAPGRLKEGWPPVTGLLEYLPRGNTLDEAAWQRRHTFLQWVLLLHVPGLFVLGLALHHSAWVTLLVLLPVLVCLVLGRYVAHRRSASFFVTAGLVYCSAALVGLSRGSIEAHFHFFIVIGFIALYQDWVPFLWDIVFTVLSHGLGSLWQRDLIFNHADAQLRPWLWSAIHGAAVLAACVGVVVFWKTTEEEQQKSLDLTEQLAETEISRRRFTSDLLVNLVRRNQSLLYRQLEEISQLEHQEEDPDALGGLFRIDHLATRIRRNAESLLVLSGEAQPRVWSEPVLLVDVVRAAIAETEDLDRVAFFLDERLAVLGRAVTDLTHLLAELVENAARFSPPEASVIIRVRPDPRLPGAQVLTIEDWGIGMPPADLAAANEQLAEPREVDLSVSQRLGLHVVARLARRHGVAVSLTPTPGSGVTAVLVLPAELFADPSLEPAATPRSARATPRPQAVPVPAPAPAAAAAGPNEVWAGWWDAFDQDEADLPVPLGGPDGGSGAPGGAGTVAADAGPRLNQRVPASHLAPELRRRPESAPAPATPAGVQTRAALSRYQASRLADRAEADAGRTPNGGR